MTPTENLPKESSLRSRLYREFAALLQRLDAQAVRDYSLNWALLAGFVNDELEKRPDIDELLGPNPRSVMHTNHACHVNFIQSIFRLKSERCFVEIVVWVYTSYIGRGFKPDYFTIELDAWKKGISFYLSKKSNVASLLTFYDAMIAHHDDFLELARESQEQAPIADQFKGRYQQFLDSLLTLDQNRAEELIREHVVGAATLAIWWESLVAPSLHRIGTLWSMGEISVAQEHMATAMTRRVMNRCFPRLPETMKKHHSTAMVVGPGEQHDIGAQMVRDYLDLCGYEVYYTGANTPNESTLFLLRNNPIDVLLISTTMPYNLTGVMDLIEQVRDGLPQRTIHIIVGGQAYASDGTLWRNVGADRYINGLEEIGNYLDAYYGIRNPGSKNE